MLKSIQKLRFKNSSDKKLAESIYLILGIYPKNIALYKQALRHSSISKAINKEGFKDSNERLEFLGDAVLGLVIAEYLFELYPFKDEGFLTKMRSRLVNGSQMNNLAIKIGLDKLVQSNLTGPNKSNGIYGDAMEALLGAVYKDLGLTKAKSIILKRLVKVHFDLNDVEQNDSDFKSQLINYCQQNKKKVEFVLLEEKGKQEKKTYLVQIKIDGEAHEQMEHVSKRRAEQLAAQLTYEKLIVKSVGAN